MATTDDAYPIPFNAPGFDVVAYFNWSQRHLTAWRVRCGADQRLARLAAERESVLASRPKFGDGFIGGITMMSWYGTWSYSRVARIDRLIAGRRNQLWRKPAEFRAAALKALADAADLRRTETMRRDLAKSAENLLSVDAALVEVAW